MATQPFDLLTVKAVDEMLVRLQARLRRMPRGNFKIKGHIDYGGLGVHLPTLLAHCSHTQFVLGATEDDNFMALTMGPSVDDGFHLLLTKRGTGQLHDKVYFNLDDLRTFLHSYQFILAFLHGHLVSMWALLLAVARV